MLAAAGVVLALVPGTPAISLDPHTALALFIAPALVDAAFDFPIGSVWRLWRQLFALAVVAVILSAGAVAWLGVGGTSARISKAHTSSLPQSMRTSSTISRNQFVKPASVNGASNAVMRGR